MPPPLLGGILALGLALVGWFGTSQGEPPRPDLDVQERLEPLEFAAKRHDVYLGFPDRPETRPPRIRQFPATRHRRAPLRADASSSAIDEPPGVLPPERPRAPESRSLPAPSVRAPAPGPVDASSGFAAAPRAEPGSVRGPAHGPPSQASSDRQGDTRPSVDPQVAASPIPIPDAVLQAPAPRAGPGAPAARGPEPRASVPTPTPVAAPFGRSEAAPVPGLGVREEVLAFPDHSSAPAPEVVASRTPPIHAAPEPPASLPPTPVQVTTRRELEEFAPGMPEAPGSAPFHIASSGKLGGNGRIAGDVRNAGTLSPGHSPGYLEVAGDFFQDPEGVLEIELSGTAAEDFDRILVEGIVHLTGTVSVSLLDGFEPALGDRFDVLVADEIQADEVAFDLPWLGPDLALVPVQLSLGSQEVLRLDTASTVSATSGAVLAPEPSTAALLALGLAGLAARRHGSRPAR